MKKFLLLCAAALLVGLPADAFGQRRHRDDRYYGRNNDRYNDRSRIRRGVRSGRLTREEARRLREQERANRAERRAYRNDGLTREERREIRRDERRSDREIRREMRDDDRRNRRRGNGYYRRGAGSPNHPVFGRRNRGYNY
ncbi:MAG TPA: hypothetical protein VN282_21160 [Pyrinomonadaceae bacterium]|nr:hypothetical protein [Pyrinomonadaceae bacterium]